MPVKNQQVESFVAALATQNSDSFEALQRENFHFHVTDHLISLFENLKCNNNGAHNTKTAYAKMILHKPEDSAFDDSFLLACSYSSSEGSSSTKRDDSNEAFQPSNIESGLFSLSDNVSYISGAFS